MNGREFLRSAQVLLATPCEPNWRSAAGRAYYALLHEGQAMLQRWGFPKPAGEQLHQFVRHRFTFPAHPDLRLVGSTLDILGRLRNQADYQLGTALGFTTDVQAQNAVRDAAARIALLDAIEGDAGRRASVIGALRTRWP